MCDPGYIKWIYNVFGDCIVTKRDKISFGIGLVSNCIWLVCSSPQIYHNFKTKKIDGFSPFYFVFIATADVLSLVGAFIVHALATQIITGFIYITLDVVLLTQFAIYGWCRGKCEKNDEDYQDYNDYLLSSQSNYTDTASYALATLPVVALSHINYKEPYTGKYLFGTISGWIGTCIYICSRVPQLIKNIKQKYLTDFSPIYVCFLISANATYSISVFVKSTSPQYLWKQTPWIVGSLVPMCFDIATGIQMLIFGTKIPIEEIIESR